MNGIVMSKSESLDPVGRGGGELWVTVAVHGLPSIMIIGFIQMSALLQYIPALNTPISCCWYATGHNTGQT